MTNDKGQMKNNDIARRAKPNAVIQTAEKEGILMSKLKLAACGIDCNECASYKVTTEQDLKAAELMLPWFRSQGLIGENEGAEAVVKKAPFCTGCWNIAGDCFWTGCNKCFFRVCCNEKQINHCGECSDFPCERYKDCGSGSDVYKKAMEYLLSLRTV